MGLDVYKQKFLFCTLCVFVSEHVICTLYTYVVWVMGLAN